MSRGKEYIVWRCSGHEPEQLYNPDTLFRIVAVFTSEKHAHHFCEMMQSVEERCRDLRTSAPSFIESYFVTILGEDFYFLDDVNDAHFEWDSTITLDRQECERLATSYNESTGKGDNMLTVQTARFAVTPSNWKWDILETLRKHISTVHLSSRLPSDVEKALSAASNFALCNASWIDRESYRKDHPESIKQQPKKKIAIVP